MANCEKFTIPIYAKHCPGYPQGDPMSGWGIRLPETLCILRVDGLRKNPLPPPPHCRASGPRMSGVPRSERGMCCALGRTEIAHCA